MTIILFTKINTNLWLHNFRAVYFRRSLGFSKRRHSSTKSVGGTEFVWISATDHNIRTPARNLPPLPSTAAATAERRKRSRKRGRSLGSFFSGRHRASYRISPLPQQTIDATVNINNNSSSCNISLNNNITAPDFKIYDTGSKYRLNMPEFVVPVRQTVDTKKNLPAAADVEAEHASVLAEIWPGRRRQPGGRQRSHSYGDLLSASPPPLPPPRKNIYDIPDDGTNLPCFRCIGHVIDSDNHHHRFSPLGGSEQQRRRLVKSCSEANFLEFRGQRMTFSDSVIVWRVHMYVFWIPLFWIVQNF